jgi:two-component system phosphate regulon sensor histidine kinase PhoR
LLLLVAAALAACATLSFVVATLTSPAAAYAAALVFGLVFSLFLRRQLQVQLGRVVQMVKALPTFGQVKPHFAELDDVIGVLQTSAERLRKALEAADDDRSQLESVLDSMQDAVVAVDGSGRIQWTNGPLQLLIPGTPGSSVRVGQALVQTIRDPEVLECVATALEAKQLCSRRTTTMVTGRIFEVNASPMPGGGAVAVLHDVTRMEEVERTQRDFVANVSHELRTPLTSITGYVETLLDMFEGGREVPAEHAREFLNTILKNATRMNRLTEDLLVMARVEAPKVELRPQPVPADILVNDAVQAVAGLLQENEAELLVEDVTDCQVFADADAVLQVFVNFIENAIKYGRPRTGGGARLIVRAREVTEPYDAVEFSVQDFGTGIPSEHLPRIFERFYRVDKTRSRDSGGTGLGLSIARHIVQTQSGSIWAESSLGSGSTFLFTLPKAIYPRPRT